MYFEAKNDLNKILELEPKNKQAKLDLEVLNNKTKQVRKYISPCFHSQVVGGQTLRPNKVHDHIITVNVGDVVCHSP